MKKLMFLFLVGSCFALGPNYPVYTDGAGDVLNTPLTFSNNFSIIPDQTTRYQAVNFNTLTNWVATQSPSASGPRTNAVNFWTANQFFGNLTATNGYFQTVYAVNITNTYMVSTNLVLGADMDCNVNKITNMAAGTALGDATTLEQLQLATNGVWDASQYPLAALINGSRRMTNAVFEGTSLFNSSVNFTNQTYGIHPLVSSNIVTKHYVDSLLGTIEPLYLTAITNSSYATTQTNLYNFSTTLVTNNVSWTSNNVATGSYPFSWIVTPSNLVTMVRSGVAVLDINMNKSVAGTLTVHPELYIMYEDGSMPEVFPDGEQVTLTSAATSYALSIAVTNTMIPATARGLVLRLKATAASGSPGLTVSVGQNYISALRIPIPGAGVTAFTSVGSGTSLVYSANGQIKSLLGTGGISVTDSGAGTLTITNTSSSSGAFTSSFTSTNCVITSAGIVTNAHGLGAMPTLLQARLKCTSADLNYSVDDEVMIGMDGDGSFFQGCAVIPDSTNVIVKYGSFSSVFVLVDKSTGQANGIDNTKWVFIIRAWK